VRQLTIPRFLHKRLNPQNPKSSASSLGPRRELARSDFFLFGYLKEKFCRASFSTSGAFAFPTWRMVSEIPEMGVTNVFTNWITRLFWMMKKDGKYAAK
jgi:hypothetical protein